MVAHYTNVDVLFAACAVEEYCACACAVGTNSFCAVVSDVSEGVEIRIFKDTDYSAVFMNAAIVFVDTDSYRLFVNVNSVVVTAINSYIPICSISSCAGVFNSSVSLKTYLARYSKFCTCSKGVGVCVNAVVYAAAIGLKNLSVCTVSYICIGECRKGYTDGFAANRAGADEVACCSSCRSILYGPRRNFVASYFLIFIDVVSIAAFRLAEVDVYAALLANVLVFGIYKVTFVPNMVACCGDLFGVFAVNAADFAHGTSGMAGSAAGRILCGNFLPNVVANMLFVLPKPCVTAVVAYFEEGTFVGVGGSDVSIAIELIPADVCVFAVLIRSCRHFNGLSRAIGIGDDKVAVFICCNAYDTATGITLRAFRTLRTCCTSVASVAFKISEVDRFGGTVGILKDELTILDRHADYALNCI